MYNDVKRDEVTNLSCCMSLLGEAKSNFKIVFGVVLAEVILDVYSAPLLEK